MIELLDKYPNLIVLQTFSKAWGMASLRLGMAFATEEIADVFARVKYPYNVNGPTQQCVIEHILNDDISNRVAEIKSERTALAEALSAMPIVKKVYPSDANFLLAKFDNPDDIYDYLVKNGIIVRNRSKLKGCEGCLRITVGTPEENISLVELLKKHPQ